MFQRTVNPATMRMIVATMSVPPRAKGKTWEAVTAHPCTLLHAAEKRVRWGLSKLTTLLYYFPVLFISLAPYSAGSCAAPLKSLGEEAVRASCNCC